MIDEGGDYDNVDGGSFPLERVFNADLPPENMVIAHGFYLPAGRFILSVGCIEGEPSAISPEKSTEGNPRWLNTVYLHLPRPIPKHPICEQNFVKAEVDKKCCGRRHFTEVAIHTGLFDTKECAHKAFNKLPEEMRSFVLTERAVIIAHVHFVPEGMQGKQRLIIDKMS